MQLKAETKAREERERRAIEAARFDTPGRRNWASSVSTTCPSCLDVGTDCFAKDEALCDGKAITFWSTNSNGDRPNFPNKSCGFTNPLEDGRLHHEEGSDYGSPLVPE